MSTSTIDDLLSQRKQFLHFLQRRVDTPATADDIIQIAYMRAIEQASELRSNESAVAWFYRILRNAVIDHYRHRAAEDRALERWANELLTQPEPNMATHEIVCQCIGKVIEHLKPSYRQIIRDIDLAEQSLDTFAKAEGITTGNATVRLHRARQALRKQLISTCNICAEHACLDCTCH
ncbi:MAG TPA: sigma-70 family RNA polymerase sigma factor [Edaphobacter sp.]|nr:sigma-70 family RNA polymerase sigma factor [Edaphobacter sp.]